jgi:nucleotide-binding universal stress UspA family protein
MLKRVLVLLGESPSSASARQYAFRLTRRYEAQLTGISGIDLTYIEAPMAGRAGSAAYKGRLEEKLKGQAGDARQRLHRIFELECNREGVSFEWLSFSGDPIETLCVAAETQDLVITGHDTAFQGDVHEQLSEMLAKLLAMTPRPLVICSDEPSAADDVLVAYDGSLPAMRAVQMFVLLGIGQGKRVHVVCIDASQEQAARRTSGAATYLRSHGYEVEADPIVSRVRPADVLRHEITDRKIGTLVMGAFGHRGWREFLFGTTTNALVEAPSCALFVYH